MKKTYRIRIGENVVFVSAETIDFAIEYAREEYPNLEITSVLKEEGVIL